MERHEVAKHLELEESYRREVAGRFLQYMQEEVRLNVLAYREGKVGVESLGQILDRYIE